MKVWALASGSSGNCYLLESEQTRLLVECGRPLRTVLRYLEALAVDPSTLHGILLTHAHVDHLRSARDLSDRFDLPIYASQGTLGTASLCDSTRAHIIQADRPLVIGEVEVRPFATPHDCVEPLGFRFEAASGVACVATDLGWVPASVQANFLDADLIVLEANYDPYLLHAGRYPAFLKSRVAGYQGHLSNQDAAEALAGLGDRAPAHAWLAHLSENSNTRQHALDAVSRALRTRGLGHVRVQAALHRQPSLHWDSQGSMEQLSLL